MALRVNIKPGLLAWAAERSGIEREILHHRFPMLAAWLDESMQPTLKQLEAFAKATYTPSGLLFLPAPPRRRCRFLTTGLWRTQMWLCRA